MGARRRLKGIALSTFSAISLAAARQANLCESEITRAASKYQVPLGILFAVGLTETGIDGNLHAYALNLEGNTVYSLNKEQAIERFNAARAAGMKLIDVGCMQLNYYFHGERFSSIAGMLDPHRNFDYAARFLSELKDREGRWTLAVARYNAGKNNNPAQKRYVRRVLERLVKSGFGAGSTARRPNPHAPAKTVSRKFPETTFGQRCECNHFSVFRAKGIQGAQKLMASNLQILVVDDYNTMVRIVRKLLKQIGYEDVDEASNGEQALGMIQNKQYGLIISDWNMEPMTGFELLQRVRAAEATAKTPFILVTAESRPDNIIAAQKCGANEYLVKPFTAPVLKEKIEKALAAVAA